jgi:hypothetical protein
MIEKIMYESSDEIPRVPRSMSRVMPPVWRSRWKAQRKTVQVAEHVQRHAPDCALNDPHEYDIAQFGEQRRREAQDPVDREQRHRQRDDRELRIEAVDDLLHHERHRDVRQLRGGEKYERDHDAPAVFPQVREASLPPRATPCRSGIPSVRNCVAVA